MRELRGRPFEPEGWGAGTFGRERLFIFITGNLFRVNRGQNIYFQQQQIFEKAKKKIKKGGGVSARV